MPLLDDLRTAIGAAHVLTGDATAKWRSDWMGTYLSTPLAVLRPGSTADVSAILKIANATNTPVVPVSGNTGLVGGTQTTGGLILSLDRMNRIRDLRPAGRLAVVEAGVILSTLHDAASAHDLTFPMTFGARGSAMIGGILSTNAGGSNVLRYGNTRDLCLGLEVVLADGRVMNLMSELHKDNAGLNLRHLMIGAEGTLGVITAAVMKLKPKPRAYATATLAVPTLADALTLLNTLQDATGGAVEAFEYMPRNYIEGHLARIAGAKPPFSQSYDVNILTEIAATAPRDAEPGPDGAVPVVAQLETILGAMLDSGTLLDAVIATNEAQRREMWARREAAAEIAHGLTPFVDTDIALPLDRITTFFDMIRPRIAALDPAANDGCVAHLGDGNIHFSVYPSRDDAGLNDAITQAVEDVVQTLGGSFSAEHGIGLSKLASMARRKDPVALDVMRAVKAALDPRGIMNPGKVIPA